MVLKITVPKRTGRKRKRGSDGPFEGDVGMDDAKEGQWSADPEVSSRSRLDDPLLLQRKLRDNIGRYEVQPVGVIRTTHRYRGRQRRALVVLYRRLALSQTIKPRYPRL